MRLPFEPTLDAREPKFYAPPQPALPPKDLAEPPARSTSSRARTPKPSKGRDTQPYTRAAADRCAARGKRL